MLGVLFHLAGCTKFNIIETMTVSAGQTVRLKCPRTTSAAVLWIRVVPGSLPELLGKTSHSKNDINFATMMESNSFNLVIKKAHVDDTGVYFCMIIQSTLVFLKRADLTVVGKYPVGFYIVHLGK